MSLGLGVGLLKQGLSSSDGLSLDLAFALDKTLTARKGPTPTFTRASTATFIGSNGLIQSAAINIPRFDHDPVTLVCRGLLVEEQRTNALLNSDTLATQNVTVTAVARTLSFYGTGTVVLSGTHTATVVGTGVFPSRKTLTFTPTAGTLTLTVTGTVQFAQLEAGAFASSYIPTTTAARTRSSDFCSITGANFTSFYNDLAGTLFCEHTPTGLGITNTSNIASIGDSQNGIFFTATGGSPSLTGIITTDESNKFNSSIGNVAFGVSRKSAMAFQNAGSAILCENGTLGTQDDSIFLPADSTGGQSPISMFLFLGQFTTIKSFRYFKKRLANAKLQTLTT